MWCRRCGAPCAPAFDLCYNHRRQHEAAIAGQIMFAGYIVKQRRVVEKRRLRRAEIRRMKKARRRGHA